jgi:transposase
MLCHPTLLLCTTSIKCWLAAYRFTGTAGDGYAVGARPPKKLPPEALENYMKRHPDAFLKEIAKEFSCCNEGARKALARNNFTLKKRRNTAKNAMRKQG